MERKNTQHQRFAVDHAKQGCIFFDKQSFSLDSIYSIENHDHQPLFLRPRGLLLVHWVTRAGGIIYIFLFDVNHLFLQRKIYKPTQHLDVIADHANVWMIQIKNFLILLIFIWADLQEYCQFIIFALLLEPFWYLLVTVPSHQKIFGLMLEVRSCHYFYCKLGY